MSSPTPPALSEVRGARTVLVDYLSVLGARGGSAAVALLSVFVTTRLLGVEGYGRLNFLLVLVYVVVDFAASWNAASVLTLGREELESSGRMGRTTWARALVALPLLALALGALLVAKLALGAYDEYDWVAVGLALGYAATLIVADHSVYLLQAAGRMKFAALAYLVQRSLVVVATGTLLVLSVDAGVDTIFLIWGIASAAGALYFASRLGRQGFAPLTIDRGHARALLAFSLPLLVTTIGTFGIRWCDIVIIKLYGDFEDVGQYALAYQGYDQLLALTVTSVSVLTPLVVSLEMAERLDVVRRYCARTVPHAAVLCALGLGVAAAPIHGLVPVVFGSGFRDAADPFVVLLFALQMAATATLIASVMLGLKMTRTIATAAIVAVALNVVLDLALVPAIGIVGAAWATAAANLLMATAYAASVSRRLGHERSRWLLAALPLAAGAAPVLLIDDALGYLVGPLAALAAFAAVVRLSDLVVASDQELLDAVRVPGPLAKLLQRGVRLASG